MFLPILLFLMAIHPDPPQGHGGIVLAGQRISFDAQSVPRFTDEQVKRTAAATRDGLARFAVTPHGRALIAWFAQNECSIVATEDPEDQGAGKAPEPGLATLVAAADHSRPTNYTLTLNPYVFMLPDDVKPLAGQPSNATDVMAAAWAAELLHISFYARGIRLPHHARADFQDEWRSMASELGFPNLPHDDGAEEDRREAQRPRIPRSGRP